MAYTLMATFVSAFFGTLLASGLIAYVTIRMKMQKEYATRNGFIEVSERWFISHQFGHIGSLEVSISVPKMFRFGKSEPYYRGLKTTLFRSATDILVQNVYDLVALIEESMKWPWQTYCLVEVRTFGAGPNELSVKFKARKECLLDLLSDSTWVKDASGKSVLDIIDKEARLANARAFIRSKSSSTILIKAWSKVKNSWCNIMELIGKSEYLFPF